MKREVWTWIGQAALGATLGLVLALAIGWWAWPRFDAAVAPDALRRDYRDDYVLMVAGAYRVEGNLERARARLAALDPEDPAAPVVDLAERLVAAGAGPADIFLLAGLAQDLDAVTPALVPYVEGGP